MWQMIGVLAELERSLITERTCAGVQAAKRRGVKFGRKPKMNAQQIEHVRQLLAQGKPPQEVAGRFTVSRTTIYRRVAAHES
jgi:DNA invertase Pin-like site-specific DNA recombinase